MREKKFDDAEDKLRALLDHDSDTESISLPSDSSTNDALLHFVLGTILRRQNRFDEALDEFTESARLMPGFPETHSQLSYLFYRTDDSDNALAEARTALSLDPANAEAYRYLGLALYADGHYDAALHAFDEALRTRTRRITSQCRRLFRHGNHGSRQGGSAPRRNRLSSCSEPPS